MRMIPASDNGRIEIKYNVNDSNELVYITLQVSSNKVFVQHEEIKELIGLLEFVEQDDIKRAK
jgi:hypothetical protein